MTLFNVAFTIDQKIYSYPQNIPLSALKACNAMNWPGGAAISF